jgi:hypothetical protein
MQMVVKEIEVVEEVRPSIFEIVVTLEGGSAVSLVMNDLTMRLLMAQMITHTLA